MLDFIQEQLSKPEIQTDLMMTFAMIFCFILASRFEIFQINRDPSYYEYDFADKELNVQQNSLRKP